jgi:hypothetical protein
MVAQRRLDSGDEIDWRALLFKMRNIRLKPVSVNPVLEIASVAAIRIDVAIVIAVQA